MLESFLLALLLPIPLVSSIPKEADAMSIGEAASPQGGQAEALAVLHSRLTKHAYFRNVEWELVIGEMGIAYIVQAPLKPQADYAEVIVERLEGVLAPLVRHFEKAYTIPFALERAPNHELVLVVVLPTQGTHADFVRSNPTEACYGSTFQFDRSLGAPILFVQNGTSRVKQEDLRRQVGGPLVLALLQAYRGERTSTYRWYFQGLSSLISGMQAVEGQGFVAGRLTAPDLSRIKSQFRGGQIPVVWHDVYDLTRVEGWGYLLSIVSQRAQRRKLSNPSGTTVFRSYGRECLAFALFLNGETYRSGFRTFIAGAMRGRNDSGALLDALEFESMLELDAAFRIWLSEQLGLELPPMGGPDALERSKPVGVIDAIASESKPSPGVSFTESPFFGLSTVGEDPDLDRSIGVALANQGRFEEAVELLQRNKGDSNSQLGAWMQAWIALREAFLAQAIESKQELRFEIDGDRIGMRVLDYDGETLHMRTSSGKKLTFSLRELDGVPLALAMKGKQATALAQGQAWVRGVPLALAGHERVRRVLRSAGQSGSELLECSSGSLAADRIRGAFALTLESLSELSEVSDLTQAQTALEELESVAAFLVQDPMLAPKLGSAKLAARSLLESVLVYAGVKPLVAGDFERLDDGEDGNRRIRIEWNLGDAAQVSDLTPPVDLEWRLKGFRQVSFPEESTHLIQESDHLRLSGFYAWSLPVALKPPMRITLSYSTREHETSDGMICNVKIGFASEDGRHFVYGDNGLLLEAAVDRKTVRVGTDGMPTTFFGESSVLELDVDGVQARLKYGEIQIASLDLDAVFASHPAGFLPLIVLETDAQILPAKIVVEGTECDVQSARIKEAWILTRLAQIFDQ